MNDKGFHYQGITDSGIDWLISSLEQAWAESMDFYEAHGAQYLFPCIASFLAYLRCVAPYLRGIINIVGDTPKARAESLANNPAFMNMINQVWCMGYTWGAKDNNNSISEEQAENRRKELTGEK